MTAATGGNYAEERAVHVARSEALFAAEASLLTVDRLVLTMSGQVPCRR